MLRPPLCLALACPRSARGAVRLVLREFRGLMSAAAADSDRHARRADTATVHHHYSGVGTYSRSVAVPASFIDSPHKSLWIVAARVLDPPTAHVRSCRRVTVPAAGASAG